MESLAHDGVASCTLHGIGCDVLISLLNYLYSCLLKDWKVPVTEECLTWLRGSGCVVWTPGHWGNNNYLIIIMANHPRDNYHTLRCVPKGKPVVAPWAGISEPVRDLRVECNHPGCSEHSTALQWQNTLPRVRENAASCASVKNKIISKSFDWSAKWKSKGENVAQTAQKF